MPKPNLDSFVFLRVLERQENILVEPETDEQRWVDPWVFLWQGGMLQDRDVTRHHACPCREYTIDLEEGSQHLIRYRTVAPLVASGAVQLI